METVSYNHSEFKGQNEKKNSMRMYFGEMLS